MAKSRDRVLAKYKTRIQNSGPDYQAGVNDPKADWMTQYTKAQPRMQAELNKALAEGRPVKGAQKSGGTQNWKDKAAGKGARNYVQSADEAGIEYEKVVDKVLEAGAAGAAAAAALPNVTQEQRLQKMIANAKAISDKWKK